MRCDLPSCDADWQHLPYYCWRRISLRERHTCEMDGVPADGLDAGLQQAVLDRMSSELGPRAEKVLCCLRTATALMSQARTDVRGLRLAASAAYNLREALDHVVKGQDAAEGGLRAVLDAWRTFKVQADVPGADVDAARIALDQVLNSVEADETRSSYNARQLLTHLQNRAGIGPLARPGDPVSEYAALRHVASAGVHDDLPSTEVEALFTRVIGWFERVFVPPDEVVDGIRGLALQPWRGQEQIVELERLAINNHHLQLFFSEVTDPAWLEPLLAAGIAQLPIHDGPWPVVGLLNGLGNSRPESVATLLERLLAGTGARSGEELLAARFELLRVAMQLGSAGHRVVGRVASLHQANANVRSLSISAACKAHPSAPVVLEVADAVLNQLKSASGNDRYHAAKVLDHLQAGVTADNVSDRAKMLAGKTRRLARADSARFATLGIEALTADPDGHPEPLLLFAHHLALVLSKARQWKVPAAVQLEWLGNMQGEVGERLRGHALAGADDVTVVDKIAHITNRLASSTASAEDLALVTDILSHHPTSEDLEVWAETLGTPSSAAIDGDDHIPNDWARAWRWAMVLPEHVLGAWQEAIGHVSERHGTPDSQVLTGARSPWWKARYGQSPHNVEALSALPPLEAAKLVAAWMPDAASQQQMFGHLELARALGDAVKANPEGWSSASQECAATLGKPLYIEHYLRALAEKAADIASHAPAVLNVALTQPLLARIPNLEHTLEELDRADIEGAVLDLARALANKDADLTSSLDLLWERALSAVRSAPEASDGDLTGDDALANAISRRWGNGLQTALALGTWEFRNQGSTRSDFEVALNAVMNAVGSVGLEFRAILASYRSLLEGIAGAWLDANATSLFRQGPLAKQTFDLTVKWNRPTKWLYRAFGTELFDAARRGVDNAVRLVVAAGLHQEEGYGLETMVGRLRKDPAVLASAAEEAAFLVQEAEPDSPHLATAIRLWTLLLDADRASVPAQALAGLGRWAFVKSIDNDRWMNLTARTLHITNGAIEYPISIADRAANLPPSNTSRDILRRLLDSGEPWERHHAATKAIEVLRASATQPPDDSFWNLRTRLIDLGHHEVSDVQPSGK